MTEQSDKSLAPIPGLRTTFRYLGALLIAATGWGAGSALETHTSFSVGARVLPRTTLRVKSQPTDVVVSDGDVGRGYVEIVEPTRLEVSNTSPQGYELVVLPQSRLFSAVTVHGAGAEVTLGGDGGSIVERRQTGSTISLELTYRFALAADVASGRYPWPLHLAVQPLDTP